MKAVSRNESKAIKAQSNDQIPAAPLRTISYPLLGFDYIEYKDGEDVEAKNSNYAAVLMQNNEIYSDNIDSDQGVINLQR